MTQVPERTTRAPRQDVLVYFLLLAAAAHLPVLADHLHEATWMGIAFTAFIYTALALATALLLRPANPLGVAAGALCLAAVTTYAATRIVAFPQLADDVGNWRDPWGLVSVSAELVVVILTVIAITRDRRSSGDPHILISPSPTASAGSAPG